jgi:hypothetical protein
MAREGSRAATELCHRCENGWGPPPPCPTRLLRTDRLEACTLQTFGWALMSQRMCPNRARPGRRRGLACAGAPGAGAGAAATPLRTGVTRGRRRAGESARGDGSCQGAIVEAAEPCVDDGRLCLWPVWSHSLR